MLYNRYDRMVLKDHPESDYAEHLKFDIAVRKFKRDICSILKQAINKIKNHDDRKEIIGY